MRAPLKKVPHAERPEPAQVERDQRDDAVIDQPVPPQGSAFVTPHSFGGASLVENAREAASKVRSLLG